MDGPPWGCYVAPEEAYVRGQAASVGSGALGGWSALGDGGPFDEDPRSEAEVRQAVALAEGLIEEEELHRNG